MCAQGLLLSKRPGAWESLVKEKENTSRRANARFLPDAGFRLDFCREQTIKEIGAPNGHTGCAAAVCAALEKTTAKPAPAARRETSAAKMGQHAFLRVWKGFIMKGKVWLPAAFACVCLLAGLSACAAAQTTGIPDALALTSPLVITNSDLPAASAAPQNAAVSHPAEYEQLRAGLAKVKGEKNAYLYVIKNHSDRQVSLSFDTDREFTFVLWAKDEKGTVVFDGALRNPALAKFHQRTIAPDGELSFSIELPPDLAPQRYFLEAYLNSNEPHSDNPMKFHEIMQLAVS